MYKYDMHTHTHEGSPDSKVGFEEYMSTLIGDGFTGMMVSDHDSYEGYRYYETILKDMDKFRDFRVIKGIEYDTYDAGHFLVVMPKGSEHRVLEERGLRLRELIDYVHGNGGILGPAHPCGEPFLSIFRTGKFKRDDSIAAEFDFLEGFNSCEYAEDNKRAKEIARKYNKPILGGSDAHWIDCVGKGYTLFPDEIRDEDGLISYITNQGSQHPEKIRVQGNRFFGTLRDKLGWANKFLVYGFYPYNKLGAIKHTASRKKALKNI